MYAFLLPSESFLSEGFHAEKLLSLLPELLRLTLCLPAEFFRLVLRLLQRPRGSIHARISGGLQLSVSFPEFPEARQVMGPVIADAPFPDQHRDKTLQFPDPCPLERKIDPVCPGPVERNEHLHGPDVGMHVKIHVFHLLPAEKEPPGAVAEAVMEHDSLVLGKHCPEPRVGSAVKGPEKFRGDRLGSCGLFRIHRHPRALRKAPNNMADGLVHHLDPEQTVPFSVPLPQALQHRKHVLHVIVIPVPAADADDPAVVIAVLSARDCVEIDQDPQAVPLRPDKGPVQILDAAGQTIPVPEHIVRDRDPDET